VKLPRAVRGCWSPQPASAGIRRSLSAREHSMSETLHEPIRPAMTRRGPIAAHLDAEGSLRSRLLTLHHGNGLDRLRVAYC